MKENTEAIVIEANFNEVRAEGTSGVGKQIAENYPDYEVEFFGSVDDGVLYVLRPITA
jgi:hypothetical protein